MRELSRYAFLAGAIPLLLLGAMHAMYTPQLSSERKGLSPADPGLAASMARSALRLTDQTNVWRAWVGFNLSHSLGLVLFGIVVVLVAVTPASFERNAAVFLPLAVVASLAYLRLNLAYWFRAPTIGIFLSVLMFSSAWVLDFVVRK
jgi:hypothetical protein